MPAVLEHSGIPADPGLSLRIEGVLYQACIRSRDSDAIALQKQATLFI